MEPRLKTSTQWTSFPEELLQQIIEASEDHFSEYEKGTDRRFVAEGRIYAGEIVLRIGLTAAKGSLRQDNFEASLEYNIEKEKALDLIHFLVDFLAETWALFFEDAPEYADLPLVWEPQTFEKRNVFLRYSSENTELEKQANALLQIDDKQLVYGELSIEAPAGEARGSANTSGDETAEESLNDLH
jgi:hypothetical protein